MGKKKTPEEKAKRAWKNGFNNDDNDDINNSLVLKELLPYTTGVYNEQMDMRLE